MENIPPDAEPKSAITDRKLSHISIVIIVGMIATTLAQTQVLGRLPLQNLLKGHLHVSREEMAGFFFWCGLAWYCKPFAGLLTDAFPIFGTRRRWYLLISSVLACLCWIALGLVPHTYMALLLGAIAVETCLVMASTVTGGYLVEAGQALKATGRLTALRSFVMSACTLVQGPIAGLLASGAFFVAAGVNATVVLTLFPIAYFFLKEKPCVTSKAVVFSNVKLQLKKIGQTKTMWVALVFTALFYFAPGFNTLLYYKQTDQLQFTQQFIGGLNSFNGGFGLLAAVVYGWLIRRVPLRTLIIIGTVTAAAGALCYLVYDDKVKAILVECEYGFFFGFVEVAFLDLAARATPKGCEGLGYSLILSIRNVSLLGADYLGSHLADKYAIPFSTMIYLNAGSTAFVLVLLPIMTRLSPELMGSKDSGSPNKS